MDVYTLDSELKRQHLIDKYESIIWTERYSALGDFHLITKSTNTARALISIGTRLFINRSQRVMTVETIEEKTNEDDVEILEIKGRSIEATLEDRGAIQAMEALSPAKYYISGIPGDIARILFHSICVAGLVSPHDIIPMMAAPTFTRDPREPLNVVDWLVEPDSLYNAIKKLCDMYELGFKVIRPTDSPVLHFYIYAGANRRSNQSENNPIVFSSELDNIENTKSLSSNQLIKNVAYVTSSAINRVIYAPGIDPTVAGFQRRILVIDLGDKGEPPNAGTYPERPPEPYYEVFSYSQEPDYGIPDYPPEPDYGAPPEGMTGYALWKEQRDIDRAQWEQDYANAHNTWVNARNNAQANWLAYNNGEYNRIAAANEAARIQWVNEYDYEVAAWNAENTRLYNLWISEISEDMTQKALEELAKAKNINTFDGELNERSSLQYGVDYNLGDLVELRNEDGVLFPRRITEQIFVDDKEGERAYPTLSEATRTA